MKESVHHIAIAVHDLDAALDFNSGALGLEVTDRVPIECEPKPENLKYLMTKCQKLGHMMKIGKDE